MLELVIMAWERVPGINKGKVLLYALSTCGWCAKTKELLKQLGVEFSYQYVDLLDRDQMQKMFTEVERYNPKLSFPTVVINDKAIIGFQEKEIREALK
ncbi:MAG: glutaredoxin family protein [Methanomicrobiales archaeon]|nr:glutaredoxin family protein [Methanomicrobiales archaeon]